MGKMPIKEETLKSWSEKVLPNYDLFFLTGKERALMETLANKRSLIMPRKEFFNHSSYNGIDVANSYMYWQIKREAEFVCVAHPEVIKELATKERVELLVLQKELNRGMIFEWEFIEDIAKDLAYVNLDLLQPYKFEFNTKIYVAIQTSLWSDLASELKITFLLKIAEGMMSSAQAAEDVVNHFSMIYPHIADYFNRAPEHNGANCLAATLASVSDDKSIADWTINHWVHEESFLFGLNHYGYSQTELNFHSLMPRDVLLWVDDNNIVQHASFYLGEGYLFNKNGQSFLNLWEITTLECLLQIWGSAGIKVYRIK